METAVWSRRRVKHLQEMSGAAGKTPGEAVITSMGSTGPPLVENPVFITDHLVSDGAQVTRPSIDPYREPIETYAFLAGGLVRLSLPLVVEERPGVSDAVVEALVRASYNMGVLAYLRRALPAGLERYAERVVVDAAHYEDGLGYAGVVVDYDSLWEHNALRRLECVKLLRIPTAVSHALLERCVAAGFGGVVIDETLPASRESPLELAVSDVDRAFKSIKEDGEPVRNRVSVVACSPRIRGSDDVFKLLGLGADCATLGEAMLVATGFREGRSPENMQELMENFILAVQKEIKLLAGAAGVSCVYTSIIGNRELFRAIRLEPSLRRRLGVKPAGVG